MSFQIGNPQGTIQYNYYRTTIHKYQNTIANSRFVKAAFHARENEPNVSFLENGYIATSLSIVQPIHVIDGISYDATMVIEHKSITNQSSPLYVCLPLKYSPNTRTEIDDILEAKPEASLVLNALITSPTAILYENLFVKKSKVAVFTVPILVGTRFESMRPGDIYIAPYSDVFSTISVEPILGSYHISKPIEGFREGAIGNKGVTQMAGYCTPIDETDPSISEATTVMIDANGGLAANMAVNTTLSTATNFFGFFVLMLFAVFATPPAYDTLLVDLVLDNETFSAQEKLNRMNAVDMATSILMFSFAFAFINYGVANSSTGSLLTGFYVFLFFLTSLIVLQYNRIFKKFDYLNKFGTGAQFELIRNDLGGLIFDNVRELFYTKVKDGDKTVNTISTSALLLATIYLIFFLVLYFNNMWSSTGSFYFISIPVAFFFLSWYLTVLINHWWYIYTKNPPALPQVAKTPSSIPR